MITVSLKPVTYKHKQGLKKYSVASTARKCQNNAGYGLVTLVSSPLESTIQILLMASSVGVPSSAMASTSRLAIPMEA